MSLITDLEPPQVRAGIAAGRGALYLVGFILLLAAVAFVLWWVFIHPGQLADAAKRAQGSAIVAEGQAKAQADAGRTVVDHYNHDAVTVTLQQKGSADVQAAAGSRDPFPAAVGDAGRRAMLIEQ